MKITTDERWIISLKDFEENVSPQTFKTWFSTIMFDSYENGILKFVIPSHFFFEWITEHYDSLLNKVFAKNFGTDIKFVEFQTLIPKDWIYEPKVLKPLKVEIITNIHDELIKDLRNEPTLVHKISPVEFEELVAFLMRKRGYEVFQTPRSRDGGKDLIAKFKTPLGDNFVCYVECKKYDLSNPVGVEYIRSLYGVVESDKVNLGMLVTTSRFTRGAIDFGKLHENRLKLKDFVDLKDWLNTGFF
jgi:restriction endonuclease Mrr